MTLIDIYQHVRTLNYPRCIVTPERVIRHSECAWLLFLSTATTAELDIVRGRIARHEARIAKEKEMVRG